MNSKWRLVAILNLKQPTNVTDVHNKFYNSRRFSENTDMLQSSVSQNMPQTIFYLFIPTATNMSIQDGGW